MKRLVLLLLALLLGSDVFARDKEAERAFKRAFEAIRAHHLLTERDLECVLLRLIDVRDGVAQMEVRENHTPKCGGAPEVAPRLFSLDINVRTGVVSWDGEDVLFEMYRLPVDGGRPFPVDGWLHGGYREWTGFVGGRFATRLDVPLQIFDRGRPSPDGRRRVLLAHDTDGGELRIFGRPAPSIATEKTRLEANLASRHVQVTYRTEGRDWLVLSGVSGTNVVYAKLLQGCGAAHGFELEYPAAKKEVYDPVVTRLAMSLRCGREPRSHRLWRPSDG
jgi:hypothetical protein